MLLFVSFVLIGTMVVLNLFIGVIMNGMEEAQRTAEDEAPIPADDDVPALETELAELGERLARLQDRLANLRDATPSA